MKLKSTVLILVMMSALTLTTFNGGQVALGGPVVPAPNGPSGSWYKYGPRVDRLVFYVAGDVAKETDDFAAGKLDIMDWAAPADKWGAWLADPEITMGEFGENAPIYLALNLMRWPLGHGDQFPEGWTSYPSGYLGNHDPSLWSGPLAAKSDYPVGTANMTWIDYSCQRCLDSRWFRRGLAHLVDRVSQVAHMAGAGVALDPSLFWPALKDWRHPSVTEIYDQAGYITKYAYDLAKARACFERGGFKDWDNDGVMEYSPTHDGSTKEELPKLLFYTRIDDEHRTFAGTMISNDMGLLGIPHTLAIATYGTVSTQVWALYDYDIYIEYWDWGPTADIYSEWFMSKADLYPEPWGNNEHRYHSKEYDPWADLFTESDSPTEAKQYCYKMQEILHRDVAAIPFYCYIGYNAHRTHYGTWTGEEKYAGRAWKGMCNYPGEGFYDVTYGWTHFNAYPEGFEKGGVLRQGLNIDAEMLDIMDAIYFYDGIVLDQIYETLVRNNPWDLTRFEPWLCEGYKVGTWQHPTAGTCSAINFTLIPGVLWQDGKPMTAADVAFTFQFTKDCKSVNYMYVKDFDSSVIYPNTPKPGRETIEIRFNVKSWLALYWASMVSIIPKHIWEPVTAKGSAAYIPEDHDTVIGTGPFRFFKDGVVGRVDRFPGNYLYLEPNPLYFRKYVWPDVCDKSHTPGVVDKLIDLDDFLEVAKPGNIFARENPDGTWPTPPGTWGPYCDVNKDGKIGVGDLAEIGVNFGKSWPPLWYEWT